MKAKIIKIVSNQYTIYTEDNKEYVASARGILRLGDKKPVVGDEVDYQIDSDRAMIGNIYPRKNQMIRPKIANVDQAIVVMSAHEPDFSTSLVDRLCFLISHANIEPVILVTKMDLVSENDEILNIIDDYRKSNFKVITTGADDSIVEALKPVLKDKISVLTGQSGVGKSSLLNRINPELQLNTQIISKALNRGKHTTRHTELHEIFQGLIADTPGFSALDFSKMDAHELALSVLEFRPYLQKCKFNDCIHENEPGCAVKEAVLAGKVSKIRYTNYLDVLKTIKSKRKY